jgi:hypothetical protein
MPVLAWNSVHVETGQVVGEQDEAPRRGVLRQGDDVVEAGNREEEAEDGQDDCVLGEERIDTRCRGRPETESDRQRMRTTGVPPVAHIDQNTRCRPRLFVWSELCQRIGQI